MRTALWINDYPVSRLGLHVERVEGWADLPTFTLVAESVPGRAGLVVLAGQAGAVAAREVLVSGALVRPTASALPGARRQLLALAGAGLVELRIVDAPEVVLAGYLTRCILGGFDRQFRANGLRVALTFTCPDPRALSRCATVVALTTSPAACPLGTAPVAPVIRIFGAATNPVLTYRTAGGVSRQTMGFTITLASTDYLEIDCEAKTVLKSVSGTVTNAIDTLTSGDFPTLDPHDGDYLLSSWPTLEVSAGAGEAAYRQAWS